jgi:hypothetical protein
MCRKTLTAASSRRSCNENPPHQLIQLDASTQLIPQDEQIAFTRYNFERTLISIEVKPFTSISKSDHFGVRKRETSSHPRPSKAVSRQH